MVSSLPPLSSESAVSVKENLIKKRKIRTATTADNSELFLMNINTAH